MADALTIPAMRQAQANIAALATPQLAPFTMAGTAPALTAPALPTASLPVPGTTAGDSLELQRLQHTGTGVSQIHNPFARAAAGVGDALYSTLLPGFARVTPGTTAHHNFLVGEAEQRLANDRASAQADATLAQTQANTRLLTDKAQEEESPGTGVDTTKTVTTDNGVYQINPATGHYDIRVGDAKSKPAQWQHIITNGGIYAFNPETRETHQLTGQGGVPLTAPQKLEQVTTLGDDGKPHTFGVNAKGQRVVDYGVHYERPVAVNVNAGNTALDRESKQFGAPHQKALDAADSQIEKIDEANAMIHGSAEAQALGVPKTMTALVSGAGSGVRITQAELNAIAKARGLGDDFTAALQKFQTGKALTPTQVNQLGGLLSDVKAKVLARRAIHADALDAINGAPDREAIIRADKDARSKLGMDVAPQHRVGDMVMYQGHPVKIKVINPDGTFEY